MSEEQEDATDSGTALRVAAIQLHELYQELTQAGFKRGEALRLLANVVATGIQESSGEQE